MNKYHFYYLRYPFVLLTLQNSSVVSIAKAKYFVTNTKVRWLVLLFRVLMLVVESYNKGLVFPT